MSLVNSDRECVGNKLTVLKLSQIRESENRDLLEWHINNYLDKFGFDSIVIMHLPMRSNSMLRDKIIYSRIRRKASVPMFADLVDWSILKPMYSAFYPYYFQLQQPDDEKIQEVDRSVLETEVTDPVEWLFLAQLDAKAGYCAPLLTSEGGRAVAILTKSKIDGGYDDGAAYLGILEIFAKLQENRNVDGHGGKALLNAREVDCLRWVAAGKTSSEIAKITSLSEHTVNHYLQVCCRKLDTVNRIQAVVAAIHLQLI